jgi:nucleoside-diphosphate-sugar epimerase
MNKCGLKITFAYMILVTGGTGLVGAHLLMHLAGQGSRIRSLYRSKEGIAKARNVFMHYGKPELFDTIEWVKGDVTDIPSLEEAFKGIEYVYHCAAFVSYDPKDEGKLRKINIEGTANMVNCALDFGVKKFCHVSSIAALGDARESETVITEETEWNPEINHNDYALSKHGAEMEAWRAWQEGLDVVIVNPGLVFGYGFWQQSSGKIFSAVKKGQQFYTLGTCGVIAVEDVANIMIKLMQSPVTGERFTLIAENITYRELFNSIADGMGKKRPQIYANRLITSVGWRLDWFLSKLLFKPRFLTRSMAKSSHKTEIFDNSKIVKQLDYKFIPVAEYLKQLASLL